MTRLRARLGEVSVVGVPQYPESHGRQRQECDAPPRRGPAPAPAVAMIGPHSSPERPSRPGRSGRRCAAYLFCPHVRRDRSGLPAPPPVDGRTFSLALRRVRSEVPRPACGPRRLRPPASPRSARTRARRSSYERLAVLFEPRRERPPPVPGRAARARPTSRRDVARLPRPCLDCQQLTRTRPDATHAPRIHKATHKRARAQFAPAVETGAHCCARCGHAHLPGRAWDIDSLDGGRVMAPSHRACNRSTSSRSRRPSLSREQPRRTRAPTGRWGSSPRAPSGQAKNELENRCPDRTYLHRPASTARVRENPEHSVKPSCSGFRGVAWVEARAGSFQAEPTTSVKRTHHRRSAPPAGAGSRG